MALRSSERRERFYFDFQKRISFMDGIYRNEPFTTSYSDNLRFAQNSRFLVENPATHRASANHSFCRVLLSSTGSN